MIFSPSRCVVSGNPPCSGADWRSGLYLKVSETDNNNLLYGWKEDGQMGQACRVLEYPPETNL
ncbi:MAG: hypothetical protein H3C63_00960 [Candidatus Omnitrophica bacterium]|nr:hypothetical protein [Candidatus Omnitrophota bacterium]MCE7909032.1 hypothetical protein [Candidatus Omnitrophica bacterium COP1]